MYKIIIFLTIILVVLGCEDSKKNIEAKKRFMKGVNEDPYHPPVKRVDINKGDFKKGDIEEFEKALLVPQQYISEQLGAQEIEVDAKIVYKRIDKVEIKKIKNMKTKKDKGASDRELPPVLTNMVSLEEKVIIKQEDNGKNYHMIHNNTGGYGKEIIWINGVLYIRRSDEKFIKRLPKNREQLLFREEPVRLLKQLWKQLDYKVAVDYNQDKTYKGKDVMVFQFKNGIKQNKKTKNIIDLKSVSGEVYFDKDSLLPLYIDLKSTYQFEAKKYNNQKVEVDFKFKKQIKSFDKKIAVLVPKKEEMINIMKAPEEKDAEEKILSFKPGHSAIDKLKLEKQRRVDILNKSKDKDKKKDKKNK